MSQATARAYRPQQFKDFVGQEYITNSLKNSLIQSKIAHGYLFSGSRGVGKTSAARVLAKALNCLNRLPDAEPCLQCQSCVEIVQGKSLDVIEIDGASHRGIDKMREIKDNLQFLPSYSQYKIYIIDEVHMLTVEAFNAILKTLEEPPSHVVFIFATTEIHKVKNTIRSRCQQYYFKRLTIKEIANHLAYILGTYQIQFEPESLLFIAKAADGSMRDSQSILDQTIIFSGGQITVPKVKEILGLSNDDQFIQLINILVAEDPKAMTEFINNLYRNGTDLSFFIVELINQMRALILIKYHAEEMLDHAPSFIDQLKAQAKYFTVYQCHQIVQVLLTLYKDIKESNNEMFYMEAAFMQLLEYKGFVHLSELVKRLEALEKGGFAPSFIANTEEQVKEKPQAKPDLEIPKQQSESYHDIRQVSLKEMEALLNEKTVEPPPVVIENIEKKSQDIVSLLWSFSKSLNNPKWQTIMSDIQDVTFKIETKELHLEFFTHQYKDSFHIQERLQEDIKTYYQERGLEIRSLIAVVEDSGLVSQEEQNSILKESFGGKDVEINLK